MRKEFRKEIRIELPEDLIRVIIKFSPYIVAFVTMYITKDSVKAVLLLTLVEVGLLKDRMRKLENQNALEEAATSSKAE